MTVQNPNNERPPEDDPNPSAILNLGSRKKGKHLPSTQYGSFYWGNKKITVVARVEHDKTLQQLIQEHEQALSNHDRPSDSDVKISITRHRGPNYALMQAVMDQDDSLAKTLIEAYGANAHYALMSATMSHFKDHANALITNYKLDINHTLMKAAMDNQIKERDQLIKALIETQANPHYALIGAHLAGYKSDIITQLANDNKSNFQDQHILVAAKQGSFAYTSWLRENNSLDIERIITLEASGAAMGGHFKYIDKLIQEYPEHKQAIINYAARDAATVSSGSYRDEVEQLIKAGADVNYAMEGAAISGRLGRIEELVFEYQADINYALIGAAIGKHDELINRLIKDYKGDPHYALIGAHLAGYTSDTITQLANDNKSNFQDQHILVAAKQGNFAYTNWLRENNPLDIKGIITLEAQGAARGGYLDHIDDLVKAYPKHKETIINGAAQGVAQNNNQQLDDLIKMYPKHKETIINEAAQVVAQNNNQHQVKQLIKKYGADQKYVAQGYAMGNHHKQVFKLMNHNDDAAGLMNANIIVYAATGAATKGHFKLANGILRYLGSGSLLSKWVVQGAHEGGHISSDEQRLYFLAQFDAKFIPKLAKQLKKLPVPIDISQATIDRAKAISSKRNANDDLTYEEALHATQYCKSLSRLHHGHKCAKFFSPLQGYCLQKGSANNGSEQAINLQSSFLTTH